MAVYMEKSEFQKSRAYSPAVITQGGRTVWLVALVAAVLLVPTVYAVGVSRAVRLHSVAGARRLPDRVYSVPLHAPRVGPGSPLDPSPRQPHARRSLWR